MFSGLQPREITVRRENTGDGHKTANLSHLQVELAESGGRIQMLVRINVQSSIHAQRREALGDILHRSLGLVDSRGHVLLSRRRVLLRGSGVLRRWRVRQLLS